MTIASRLVDGGDEGELKSLNLVRYRLFGSFWC
jgi:hypothetical protein